MAVIKLTIPDTQMPRVVKALARYFDYKDTLFDDNGIPYANPETRRQFVIRSLQEWMRNITKDADVNLKMADYMATTQSSIDAARAAAIIDASSIDITASE